MSDYFTINKRLIAGILTKYRTTLDAFCELVTNSIQGKAKNIWIEIATTEILSGTVGSNYKKIQIKDDGVGVSKSEFKAKILDIATDSKKEQGGKGVGRFAALQLGSKMMIETISKDPLDNRYYKAELVVDTKQWIDSKPLYEIPLNVIFTEASPSSVTGYSVAIDNFYSASETKLEKHLRMLKCFGTDEFERILFERYTDVILREQVYFHVNGKKIDAKNYLIGEVESSTATFTAHDAIEHELSFQYMQVKGNVKKHKVFLRVQNGTISTVAHSYDYAGDIPADNQWIMFVDSPYFGTDTDSCRGLFMSELNPDTPLITSKIKESIDTFFSKKYEKYYDFTANLKSDSAYPYREKAPSSSSKSSVFNQLAYYIEEEHHLLKKRSDLRNLVYGLIDRSLNIGGYNELITTVLNINGPTVTKFKELLEQVDVEDVVTFCDEVRVKEQFLDFLFKINYEKISNYVYERSQLHKIVQKNLWIFGEQYNNSPILFSDKNLQNNLIHIRSSLFNYAPTVEDDNVVDSFDEDLKDITDLFFFNEKIVGDAQKEIMIVELKAPRVKLNQKELSQAERYAFQIRSTAAFPDGLVYKIILIGSDIAPFVREKHAQIDPRNPFLVYRTASPKIVEVWAMKWSDLIDVNHRKLSYMSNQLKTKDREVSEYWQANYGEVPTKGIFSSLENDKRDD